jgi:hypothetical protein
MNRRFPFIAAGRSRHRAAIAPTIEAEVMAEFAPRLANASRLTRWRLQVTIRREIRRRVVEASSERALY